MRLNGSRVPGAHGQHASRAVGAALYADLTDEERDELLEHLAWYRTWRRSRCGTDGRR